MSSQKELNQRRLEKILQVRKASRTSESKRAKPALSNAQPAQVEHAENANVISNDVSIEALKAEYKSLSGKNAFFSWSKEKIQEKIAELKAEK